MATKVPKKEEDKTKVRKNFDNWKYPKIPVNKIYMKQSFSFFPKCTIKDSEKPITVVSAGKEYTSLSLLPWDFVKRFIKKKHQFIHLGLVQIAINPLVRDGLDSPITVCLRDSRQQNFKDSWLAVVETNMSHGPFYFNCFPSFSVSRYDLVSGRRVLNLRIKSTGTPLAVTVRVVCKAMVDLSAEYLEEPMLGKTNYYHATSGTPDTTLWDEVKLEDHEDRARKLQLAELTSMMKSHTLGTRPSGE